MAEEPRPEADTDKREPETETDRVATLEAEVANLKDRMLRTLAEMENLRRRSEREMADTRQYAVANFARDMLTVSDNLRRAIAALPTEKESGTDPALAALIEGVEVTERGLVQTLQKFGVRPIEAAGQKFDPAHHQAMFEVENEDLPPGTVADVVQTGYLIGERVLRPALVGVTKAGRKPADKAEDKTQETARGGDKKTHAEANAQPADRSAG